MKKLSRVLLMCLGLVMYGISSVGAAVTVNFGDSTKYWNGWGNSTKLWGTPDNNLDVIGDPDFNPNNTGGTAVFSSGRLTKLGFKVNDWKSTSGANISPGDLFISIDGDSNWEYVVDLTTAQTWKTPGKSNTVVPAGNYAIYAVDIPLNSNMYTLSGKDTTGNWAGFYIRDNHPVAWGGALGAALGTVNFSGWGATPYFDFTTLFNGLGLPYSPEGITIGWAANCANDVLYEHINAPPVPEPATILLVGSGLLGVGVIRKRSS